MKRTIGLAACLVACGATPALAQTWTVTTERDAFDDRPNVTASVRGRSYVMGVRCKADVLEVLFLGGYVGDEDANVRYRFDGGEVHEDVWSASTSRDGLFADAPGEVARWLSSGSRLAFEYEDFSGTPNQFSISLAGSGNAIGRVLDACGVPRTDPRTQDSDIWRRAVIDIDKVEKRSISNLQSLLNDSGFELSETGRRDLPTYRALSDFYRTYWSACQSGAVLTGSCDSWRSSRRYNPEADYPKEPIELFLEVIQDDLSKNSDSNHPDGPGSSLITNPSWARMPSPEFPEQAASLGITSGTVTLECSPSANGSLTSCSIVSEDPSGAGFGQAALRSVSRARLSPRTVDDAAADAKVRWTIRFRIETNSVEPSPAS